MNLKQLKQQLNNNSSLVFEKLGMNCEVFSDNIYSTCPVHASSDNPRAFSFSTNKGIWKCWTRDCQNDCGNDIFGLIKGALTAQRGKDVEFAEVLNWSKALLNITDRMITTTVAPQETTVDPFYQIIDILSAKETFANHKPLELDFEVKCPSQYFLDRGFSLETLKYFEVGDCKDVKSPMNERSVIPIHNDDGSAIIAVIGRTIREYRSPKFLFYPKGFDKRYAFYNYHRAIKRASETSCLFLVEGQGDVWKLFEAGVHNAVGMFGKTITKEQESKLYKLPITHLIVLTDNDQAGREAKLQIKRQFNRMFRLSFPKLVNKDVGDMSVDQIQNTILNNLQGTF